MTIAAALMPAAASAKELPVGVTTSPVITPTCPADAQKGKCTIVLTQVTAYETRRDGVLNPDMIKKSGVISAFTLGLASTSLITPAVLANLDQLYGGPPEAQLTILRPVGTATNPSYRVAAESPVILLRGELGKVAEIPLATPLPVVRGEMVALTVPTWAPVLTFELDTTKFAYAQSRDRHKVQIKVKGKETTTSSCVALGGPNLAQIVVGGFSSYGCTYPGVRVEYSALEITTPSGFASSIRKRHAAARHAR